MQEIPVPEIGDRDILVKVKRLASAIPMHTIAQNLSG